MLNWDASQYLQFQAQRTQPAIDLANRIRNEHVHNIIDIGCGPGNSTRVLKSKFHHAYILGIDSSAEMIDMAKNSHPDIDFVLCDAGQELSRLEQKYDVVFSNACIQWIPNHPQLLRDMFAMLNREGELAIQLPMNDKEPIHLIIDELTKSQPWKEKIASPRVFHQLRPDEYFDCLSQLTDRFELWETTYYHVLPSHEAILEWYRGTGLRPYLQALSSEDRTVFEKEVYHQVVKAYPVQENGEIIFRFPRFFMLAVK